MALSKSSKILIDDINTALSDKIDTAGTGLSKSGTSLALASVVTAGDAGPSANATLAYSGTFTVPYITYDAYGRVTGRTNRTMTMPSAPSGGTASAVSGVHMTTGTTTLPSGGSWRCAEYWNPSSDGGSSFWSVTTRSGGASVSMSRHSLECLIAIRTS